MRIGTVDINQLRGVGDKGFGLGKELVGVLTGNERLEREGEAQQERATAELRAMRNQVHAQKEEMKAKASEQKERLAQRAKESSKENDR